MHVIETPKPPFEQNAITPGLRTEPPQAAPLNLGTALKCVLQMAGVDDFLEPSEREQLAALDGQWSELNSQLEATTHAAIRRRFRELMSEGKPETQSALEERGALLRRSLKDRMRLTTSRAVPIAVEASRRLAAIAEGVAADLEPVERDEAARLGFDFVPSPLLKAAKHFAHHGRSFEPYATASCRPSNLLPYVVE